MSTNENIFSDRLREAMRIRNVSAAELARTMRTTSSTVFGWLKGTKPRPRAFEDLAQTLKVPLAYLKGESDYEFGNETAAHAVSNAETAPHPGNTANPIGLWESKLKDLSEMGHENAWILVERSLVRMDESPESVAKELPSLRLLLHYLKTTRPEE